MSKPKTVELRLNVLVRLLALVFLVLGTIIIYYTYSTPSVLQISIVLYTVSILLILSGIVALISKLD